MKILNSLKNLFNTDYEEDDILYDDYDDEEPEEEAEPKKGLFSRFKQEPKPKKNDQHYEVRVFKPSSVEDSREIADTLLDGNVAVINFEGKHAEVSQRVIDFVSGVCYSLDGALRRVSNYVFVVTPPSVDMFITYDESEDEIGFRAFSTPNI